MKSLNTGVVLILCIALSGVCFAETSEFITIGTFNIQHFGQTEHPERIQNLAGICEGIDLLAIQEVHPEGADAVKALAQALGDDYRWTVSDVTTWERFAYVWRLPVEMTAGPWLMDKPALGRKPYFAAFKAGNFEFEMLNIHLFWDGSKKTYPHHRSAEFKILDDWLTYRNEPQLGLLLVGDFNAPELFYGHNFPPPLSSAYFFYQFLNRHSLTSVTVNAGIPTSIMNKNIYDHIIFNPSRHFVPEFAGQQFVSVVKWEKDWDTDGDGKLGWDEYQAATKAVTDHRLVTATFRIDMPVMKYQGIEQEDK
jgi:endonuclease/exonuclease/phosphatase family metal-dependent hydrolase